MELTLNEANVLKLLESYSTGFATVETVRAYVFPSTNLEATNTIHSLMGKGAPIRDVGLEKGGWRLESPHAMVNHYLDLIKESQKRIEKIMEYSNERYEKFIESEVKK
ncbi:hypothetical protein [Rummeliibacillus sp. TYF-LIM-RU47]|uniref:hypothetical protein n=1 Tax=Rummeliibacillus sp. TYF-LIM-RU47 TaxID=2608406 RepID=UPI00123A12B1|nr:hypothetical protein [Rummeliibacillus sp. TYF-LIM-RU47]